MFAFIIDDPEAESENCSTKTYYLSSLPLFWIEALLTCRSYSMNLLTIGSSAEYNYLKTVIQLNNTLFQSNTFVGLTRLNGNQWYWINEGNLFNVTTVNWWPGEPNGGGASECAALVQSGVQFGLNDLGCRADVFRFICEDIY